MKKYRIFCILSLLLLVSCAKEDARTGNEINAEKDRYYVKYDASINASGPTPLTIVAMTETGEQTFKSNSKEISYTFGPLPKGFHATLNARSSDGQYHMVIATISISKNQEPFVVKDYGSSELGRVTLEYTIDF